MPIPTPPSSVLLVNKEQTPAPSRVRVPLGPVPWASGSHEIVHVGQSALLLARPAGAAGGDLLPVTSRARGLVPGGLCIPNEQEFARLVRAVTHAGHAEFSHWQAVPPADVTVVDLRVRPQVVQPEAVAELVRLAAGDAPARTVSRLMDPRPLRQLAGPLTRAALRCETTQLGLLLQRLVGAGPGATPTGDDVIVGVLAALHAAEGSAAPRQRATAARERLSAAVLPLLPRTTRASRHDLTAAAHGVFGEHVHALLAALVDATRVPATFASATGWGATSGVDLACGLAVSASTALRHRQLIKRRPVSSTDTTDRRSA